jgi:polysaccharide export outer membrane protein
VKRGDWAGTAVRATWGGLLLLGLCAGVVEAQAEKPSGVRPAAAAPGAAPEYSVGPGDLLQVVVWKEPDLTRDVLVRVDGRITLPLLGEIEATGRSPKQLADEIARGLGRFITAPQVSVGVSQAAARVYVIGQVARSGELPLSIPLTVVQALALSGGFQEFARTDSILVVGRDRTVRSFNYKRFEVGRDLEFNVTLRPGDTVVVP